MPRLKGSKNKPKTAEEINKQIEEQPVKAEKRTLYECFNAKMNGKDIRCAKGHRLSLNSSGTVNIERLARGEPLALTICQGCPDFDSMGDPVPANEKGWLGKVI